MATFCSVLLESCSYNRGVLSFRAGDPGAPRGHALVFFNDADNPGEVWATYLVVAPIAMDLAKYIPAAFAAQIPAQLASDMPTAYPLPPVPEKVEGGIEWLERLASVRKDDLIDGGVLRMSEPWQAMHPVGEIGRQYAESYAAYVEQACAALPEEGEPASAQAALDVDALLLQVMPDREKVGRLARLVGTLRYAVEGGDAGQVAEAAAEMERVGRHLGEKYRVTDLIAAAQSAAPRSGELAQLYVERCYRLVDEDYGALAELDRRIEEVRSAGESA